MSAAKKSNDKPEAIHVLEAQIANLTLALQRERADAENIRRRHQEQLVSLRDTVKIEIVRDLLPIIDNFERALSHSPVILSEAKDQDSSGKPQNDIKQYQDFIKGVQSIVKQFEKTLADMGVERIKTIGQPFDPNLHEAVSVDGEDGEEIVSEELQSGYVLAGNVLRHATVRVTRG